MKWIDAIIKVFEKEKRALHYTEIAELIAENNFRVKFGATPANTVNVIINQDIKEKNEKSFFKKFDNKGEYILRKQYDDNEEPIIKNETTDISEPTIKLIIKSLGIYWHRNMVYWNRNPKLYGIQQRKAKTVDFSQQIGIYLLHDINGTIYVGQAIKQPIITRLWQHTSDRLGGRWDRFSWYGFYGVNDKNAELVQTKDDYYELKFGVLADTIESVLIESLEPRQNRRQGNVFSGIEYMQKVDPEIERSKEREVMDKLQRKLDSK